MNTGALEEILSAQPCAPAAAAVEMDEIESEEERRSAFLKNFDGDEQDPASWSELVLAAFSLAFWFLLFCGGTLVGTTPFVAGLGKYDSAAALLLNATMVLLFWTISNIGLLCMLSAILGAFGARTRFATRVTPLRFSVTSPQPQGVKEVSTQYASAAMRGFGVFVLILSGLLILATDSLINPNQGQYVRLAGLVSVISFYAGYDPVALAELLKRIEQFLRSSGGK